MDVQEALMMQQPQMQRSLSAFFFSFAASFFLFSLLLMLLRWRSWCSCDVCRAFMASSWADDGFRNLGDWYAHLLRHSTSPTIHVHVLDNTITADPANVEHMLKTRFDNYPKGKPFSSILGDLLGRGIFAADGDPWRFQRKMASLELGSVSVRSYAFDIVSAELRTHLLPLLSSFAGVGGSCDSVLDLQDVFRRFSFDTICRISFGLDPGCLELGRSLSEFAAAFDEGSRLSAARALSVMPLVWKVKRLLNVGSERELRRAVRLIDVLSQEVIRQRRQVGTATFGHDLLSRFLASTDDERYLRDIVISFLLAGRDTVASGLTTFFLLLSKYPEVEAKILEEIKQATAGGGARENGSWDIVGEVAMEKSGDGEVESYAQLRDMHYVHAALYESMRLYPPVQFDSRFAVEDDVLPDGTFVRRGTRLTYHTYAMGRMEELWGADCNEFRPERWLNGDGTFVPQSPFRYPVFHAGSRICLGKELALMEMKGVVVAVLRRFRVEVLDQGHPPKFASGLTATLVGGLRARFRVR